MYNASAYLHECIDSILCQTFADFELLVVDDGSEDGSIGVLELYNDPPRNYSLYNNNNNIQHISNNIYQNLQTVRANPLTAWDCLRSNI